MRKYLTKLMFIVHTDKRDGFSEFDEQIRVVESRNMEDAFYKARKIGRQEEETFINRQNSLISWKFVDVTEIYALEEIKDGEQLYSNTHQIADSKSYISYIRQKSMEIQAKNLTFA